MYLVRFIAYGSIRPISIQVDESKRMINSDTDLLSVGNPFLSLPPLFSSRWVLVTEARVFMGHIFNPSVLRP